MNFSEALNFSRTLGMVPNTWVTVQWKYADSPHPPADRLQRLLNLIGIFLRRRGGVPPVWGYVREVGRLKGEHLHLLVFVPPLLRSEFTRNLRGWLLKEAMDCDGDYRERAINVQPITSPAPSEQTPDLTDLKRYCLKEGTDEVRRAFWIPTTAKYRRTRGTVEGKRIKVSHAIGRHARTLHMAALASENAQDGRDNRGAR